MAKPKSCQKEDNIFVAALSLFSKQGYSNTTIKKVAIDAGVSFGTVFTYYSSKEELLHACVAKSLKNLENQIYVSRNSLKILQ